jgi:hypothetical protein
MEPSGQNGFEFIHNFEHVIMKMSARSNRSKNLDSHVDDVLQDIGALYDLLYKNTSELEQENVPIKSGSILRKMMLNQYNRIFTNDGNVEEFYIYICGVKEIIERLNGNLRNCKLFVDTNGIEKNASKKVQAAENDLVSSLENQLTPEIKEDHKQEPERKQSWIMKLATTDPTTLENHWQDLDQMRSKQTLKEFWRWEMSVFGATEAQTRQRVESRKMNILEKYSRKPFPAFDQSTKDSIWEYINKFNCLILPFHIKQVMQMSREELIQIGEKYFCSEYTNEDSLDEIRDEILDYMSSLNPAIGL